MYKAFKFRMYPTNEQKISLHKNFGCARFVYNYYLNDIKRNGYKNAYACIKDYTSHLKGENTFLSEADSCVIRKSLFHLEDNIKRSYNSTFGYPRFKSRFDKNSYTTSAIYSKYKNKEYCNIEVDIENKRIKLPKIKWVNIRGYRNIKELNGRIISATISKETSNKYYVSVMCEVKEEPKLIFPREIVGLDIGIKNLVILSNGTIYENNKYIEKYEKRIKRKQRELARKTKHSNNYNKCKQQLAILYKKLQNARKYYIHKITKEITDKYDVITSETLNTKAMIEQKKMSKRITDASFSEILRQIKYKAEYKGKHFYQVDKYYASSQSCSVCGRIDKKYNDITIREYACKKCGNRMDRDINASINIMYEGLLKYAKEKYSKTN